MINGKELVTVLSELQAPCPKKKSKDNYSYYPIEIYEERLNSVVGKTHYKVSYTEPQLFNLPTSQVMLMVRCEMAFIDDSGSLIYQTEGIGSYELTYSDKYSSYINLNNCGYCLQVAALKSACKSLDMFGMHESKEAASAKQDSKPTRQTDKSTGQNTADASAKKAPATQHIEEFLTAGKFEIVRTDSTTGKPVYKVSANRVVNNQMQTKPVDILFYPNQYKNCADKANHYVALCNDGERHRLQIKYSVSSSYYGTTTEQLIFKGFAS